MTGEEGSDIQLRREGRVATLAICRPAKRNALAPRHFRSLVAHLAAVDADPDIGAVILTGEGDRAFCAGADLSPEEHFLEGLKQAGPTGLGDVLRAAHGLGKPLIARVNGHCYAGGIGLLAACDLAVACEDASFALPEVKLGIFPFVVLAGLAHRIAPMHLARLALTGSPIDAPMALQIGLVSHVTPRSALDSTTDALAADLARQPAGALREGLLMWRGGDSDVYLEAIARAERNGQAFASSNRASG